MNSSSFSNISIVVRECGERTADAAVGLLAELAGATNVHRVCARPFHATLRHSLELGLQLGREWTLCIDADVLVLPELTQFVVEARQLPGQTFGAQALIRDKLIPTDRPAGNHLYRTELIPTALPLIPVRDSLRPESDMIRKMTARGHRYHQSTRVVGLHDFEQAFADLYKKAFLHGHKHDYLIPLFRPIWETLSRKDDDFRVALAALDHARRCGEHPEISRDFRDGESQAVIDSLGLQPKPPLAPLCLADVVELQRIDSTLDDATQRLADQIQRDIDIALFPPPAAASRGWIAASRAIIRRASNGLSSLFGAR